MKGAGVLIEKGRFFWDAAGPVFPHQVQGLLGYGVTIEWVVYGSVGRRLAAQMDARVRGADDELVLQDYPYAPPFTFALEIQAIENATFLSAAEKEGVFATNSQTLFNLF